MVSLQMLHWNMRFIYSKHLVRYWVKSSWDTGECVFLRGTMSNTEITEMNAKVLYTCMCTYVLYFIDLYL